MISFNELFSDVTRKGKKIPTKEYLSTGRFPIVDQGKKVIAGYSNDAEGLYTDVPAIVFGDHTRIVKYIDQPFFLGADGAKIITCNDEQANVKYWYYALKAARIPDTGYNRHFKWLKELYFHHRTVQEQERIVNIFSGIDLAVDNLELQLFTLDKLVKSRFVEMFGDPVLNPMGWEIDKLGTICDVRDGTHDSPKYYNEGFPLVTSKNVTSGKIDLSSCSFISKEDYEKINKRSKVDVGDIIMPMIGTVGNPVIVDFTPNFAIKNVALIKSSNKSAVHRIYVKALLESNYFDSEVMQKIRGGTQKFISLGDIRKLQVLVPPLALQNQFADFVALADKSKSVAQALLAKFELLREKLMQDYFG